MSVQAFVFLLLAVFTIACLWVAWALFRLAFVVFRGKRPTGWMRNVEGVLELREDTWFMNLWPERKAFSEKWVRVSNTTVLLAASAYLLVALLFAGIPTVGFFWAILEISGIIK
jgi:hypothetical protein